MDLSALFESIDEVKCDDEFCINFNEIYWSDEKLQKAGRHYLYDVFEESYAYTLYKYSCIVNGIKNGNDDILSFNLNYSYTMGYVEAMWYGDLVETCHYEEIMSNLGKMHRRINHDTQRNT